MATAVICEGYQAPPKTALTHTIDKNGLDASRRAVNIRCLSALEALPTARDPRP